MTWWLWGVLGLGLLIAETIIPAGFFLLFFGVAALLLGILLMIVPIVPAAWQWILFALGGPILAVTLRPYLKSSLAGPTPRDDRDNFVGGFATATAPIPPQGSGHVECRGTSWQALNVGAGVIDKGERCVIKAVNNLTLSVSKE